MKIYVVMKEALSYHEWEEKKWSHILTSRVKAFTTAKKAREYIYTMNVPKEHKHSCWTEKLKKDTIDYTKKERECIYSDVVDQKYRYFIEKEIVN